MLVRGLAARMREFGHEIAVLTYVESVGNELHEFGFHVSEFDGAPLWELHYNLACAPNPAEAEFDNPLLAELVARAVREIKPDLIHAMHLMKLSVTVMPRLKELGLPVVATFCDFWPLCLRHTLLKADGSICLSGPDHPMRCLRCAQATHGFARTGDMEEPETALWSRAERAKTSASVEDADFRRDVLAISSRTARVRDAYLLADRLFVLTAFQRECFVRHGYPEERLQVCPIGIDLPQFEQARIARQSRPTKHAADMKRIVFISPLALHKGLHILLEALRRVPDPRLELRVYGGPGPEPAYNAEICEMAGRDHRVSLHGVIPPEEVGDVLLEADALALPVIWFQNDPMITKTALHVGVRVAMSRIGGLAEQMPDADCGWLLPPGDVEAWAAWALALAQSTVAPLPSTARIPSMSDYARRMHETYRSLIP